MAIVYEHLRNDTNEVFYVGIGVKEGRAFEKHGRNPHWHNIVNKAGYTVNIVYKDIEHDEAKQIEILLIEKYGRKDLGLGNLVNMTDGGEGALGVIISEETRQKLSKANKGKPKSEEHIKKISEANKGKTLSEETRQKMSERQKGEKHHNFGKATSEEVRKKMSEASKGKPKSEEHIKKMSESRKGEKHHNFGKTTSEETRQKMSKAQKGEKNHMFGKNRSDETRQKMSKAKRNQKNVKGYSFHKATKKYKANITVESKGIHLGLFDTPGEASEAYQKARLLYFV